MRNELQHYGVIGMRWGKRATIDSNKGNGRLKVLYKTMKQKYNDIPSKKIKRGKKVVDIALIMMPPSIEMPIANFLLKSLDKSRKQ